MIFHFKKINFALVLTFSTITMAATGSSQSFGGLFSSLQSCKKIEGLTNITSDTKLCGGETVVINELSNGKSLVKIEDQENLTIECDAGLKLRGQNSFGTTAEPTAGFLISNSKNITIKNCAAEGFRFGLIVQNSENVNVEGGDYSSNFHNLDLGWVQDNVHGGGIRFFNVNRGSIVGANVALNWNGIDFRYVKNVTVESNAGNHCSNTGITLIESHHNVIRANDFSWGIRGISLEQFERFYAEPYKLETLDRAGIHKYLMEDKFRPHKEQVWYVIDTKDSAGIIVDAGSQYNLIENNDFEFGGDGIFVRRIIGNCPAFNTFINNRTSYSPHNAIESWCDQNHYFNNDVSHSHYGFWLGGSDDVVVKGNTIIGNIVDGISSQILENRRYRIEGNEIRDNGRTGILLSGYQVQAWHKLSKPDKGRFVNTSHIIIQNNSFARNEEADIHLSGARGIFLGNNLSQNGDLDLVYDNTSTHIIELPEQNGVLNQELFDAPESTIRSEQLTYNVGDTAEFILDSTMTGLKSYSWQIQNGNTTFLEEKVEPDLLLIERSPYEKSISYTFDKPGVYEINAFVDNGYQIDLASYRIQVIPKVSNNPRKETTRFDCYTIEPFVKVDDKCNYSITEDLKYEMQSIRVDVEFFEQFIVKTPIEYQDANANFLSFFLMAENRNYYDWQDHKSNPVVEVHSENGITTYKPVYSMLPTRPDEWSFFKFPLKGGDGWTRESGYVPENVYLVRFIFDSRGYKPYSIWLSHIAVSEQK